jgi:hypothetical protein
MGGRGDGAGEGLAVDVAEVLEGEPALVEAAVESAEDDSGLDLHEPALGVGRQNAVEAAEVDEDTVAERDVGERMARAGGADREPALAGASNCADESLAVAGPLDHGRAAALITRPVAPLAHPRRS